MKRLLFAATMLATLFVSCMKSEIEVVTVIPSSKEFTASFDDATRTELDGTTVVWNEEDLLTIFTKTSHNRKYKIKELSSDCRTATFSYIGFTGTDGTKITTNYALYPYDAEATLANGVITTKWASEQTYDAETGNLSYALMTAASETTNFSFTNAGALLRFKLSKIVPDEFTLRGIKLTSATQNIAGEITIDLNGNKRAVVTDNGVDNIYLDAINTEITLDVQEFYVATPAMSFDKGDLSVTFMFDEGNKEFALPAFELVQGSIKNIEYTIKDAEEFTGSTPGDTPTNNEIWYTNGSTTEATTPTQTDVFGVNIVSNTYDAEKECWVIKFDGDVTTIGVDAFRYCDSLTSVNIPDSVTTIGEAAFRDCGSLTSVTIPDSITSIGDYAFYTCGWLTSVYITDIAAWCNISFGNKASNPLHYAGNLYLNNELVTDLIIPDSVTSMESSAFYGCTSLTSVTIPDSVTSIGSYAFGCCFSLTGITIPDSVTSIGSSAFRGCGSLTSITIPDSVTSIGDEAFWGCDSLTSVTIPDSVTSIGSSAFRGCGSLTSITIPDSVTSIGDEAFRGCTSLTSITIPDSVTSIGNDAFIYCTSLEYVYCKPTTPPTGGSLMFYDNASGRTIYVPRNSVNAYQAASGWSEYADSIVAYDFENGKVVVSNEIWYTNGSTTEATTPNKTDVFGVNIVSNTYDAEKECWVIKFEGDVTTIGSSAFYCCSSLTSVTIPDSVTTIGSRAFLYCDGLTSITIPNSVTTIGISAFEGCSGLTSVNIPDSVTSIGEAAFRGCSSLTSVTIPDSVTTIGKFAFSNCGQLQEFKGKFASDDGRCLIQYGKLIAFAPAELTEYAIPDGVTTIDEAAFYDCSSLTSITIPDGVTTIGESAFDNCSSLTSVNIPDSVTTIENYAFYDCSSLISITIPDSVTTIGEAAFYDCSSLTSITIPDSVTTIGISAFEGCSGLTSVTIPDSVTSIGSRAFVYCDGLTSVTIPDSVTTIDSEAFGGCSGLTSVTIPDSVTTIDKSAFYYCLSLTSVTIGNGVTSIGNEAFGYCPSLKEVYCKPTTPPTGGSSMFDDNASGRKIYVPSDSVEAYKAADAWDAYADDIYGYDFENNSI